MKLSRIPRDLLFLAGATLIVLGTLPMASLVKYTTSTPSFCMSCHAQGVARVAATSQVHPAKVGCTSCHAKGKWPLPQGFPQSFSADDDVLNPNCLRCHSEIPNVKLTTFKSNGVEIRVPHKFHVGTVGAKCTTCHRNVAHDSRAEPTNRPAMNTCLNCHGQTPTCNTCHLKLVPTSSTGQS